MASPFTTLPHRVEGSDELDALRQMLLMMGGGREAPTSRSPVSPTLMAAIRRGQSPSGRKSAPPKAKATPRDTKSARRPPLTDASGPMRDVSGMASRWIADQISPLMGQRDNRPTAEPPNQTRTVQRPDTPRDPQQERDRRVVDPGPRQPTGFQSTVDMLFGDGGGNEDMLAAISESYGGQRAALEGWGNELEGLTQGLIGNINASATGTNDQIGSYYDYAAHQANAGRPVIAETGETAMGNVDEIYNTLATNLAAIPDSAVDRASSAAGSAIGGSVAGRVASSIAPFQAAGETSRANTQANLTQHSAAGQDYLSQLAAAAPSDAAMRQAGVTGRANNAVTEAEMALAQQRAEIAAQTAALEGAEQRALIEATADTSGSTFDRIMQTVSLGNALGADMSGMAADLGFTPAGPEPRDPRDVLAEIQLDDALQPAGYTDFGRAADQADPATSDMAWTLFNMAESQGMDVPGVMQIIDQFTNEPEREVEQERSPFNPLRWFGADTYTETEGGGTAESLDDLFIEGPDGTLMINPEQSLFTEANQAQLRELMRIAFS